MSKLPKLDRHPRYKSTSCRLSSISSIKNSTFQYSSFYELYSTYKFIYIFVLQFYNPNSSTIHVYKEYFWPTNWTGFHLSYSSFETVSNLSCNHTHHHCQPPTPLTLKNCLPFIVQLCKRSPLIIVIVINHRLIVLKPEYCSSFIYNYSHIYHSLTNWEGRVNLDLTFII